MRTAPHQKAFQTADNRVSFAFDNYTCCAGGERNTHYNPTMTHQEGLYTPERSRIISQAVKKTVWHRD